MRVFVVTPPEPVVTWEDVDAQLRLGGDTAEKVHVEALIAAATANLDGPGGWLGRALGAQTLEARLDKLSGNDAIFLPFVPIIDIVSVKYLDTDNVEQTVDSAVYELRGDILGLAYDQNWPAMLSHPESVRVRYRAGYVADPEADPLVNALPATIRAAILLMVGDLFKFRETASELSYTPTSIPMSTTVQRLLSPLRIMQV